MVVLKGGFFALINKKEPVMWTQIALSMRQSDLNKL